MKGFLTFVREQGVVGLAVGIILGGSVSKLVTSLVNDIVNPVLGPILGAAGKLSDAVLILGPVQLRWGSFMNSIIDFVVIALIVYVGVKVLRFDRVDKKKENS